MYLSYNRAQGFKFVAFILATVVATCPVIYPGINL